MIVPISQKHEKRHVIDLTGPQGNAFYLLSVARSFCHAHNIDYDFIKNEMTKADFEHLVQTFDKHFGDYVIIYR